jgi:hypothetical protein
MDLMWADDTDSRNRNNRDDAGWAAGRERRALRHFEHFDQSHVLRRGRLRSGHNLQALSQDRHAASMQPLGLLSAKLH